jgi:hypothetical protein
MAHDGGKGDHRRFGDGGHSDGPGHGKSVTFDQFDTTTYLHSDVAADTSFSERLILQVNGFELNGAPVELPGFGTNYGMYFVIDATGHVPANGVASYDTMHIALMVDPGNNDGTLSSTEQGVGFVNGTGGDFALASGTLESAGIQVDPDGTRHPDFVQKIEPTEAGEKIFGASLDPSSLLQELLTTPGGPQIFDEGGGKTVDVVNGAGATGLPATGVVALDPQAPLSVRLGLLNHDSDGHGGLFCAAHG